MGMKANSNNFYGTKGSYKYKLDIQKFGIKETISSLPANPKKLLNDGWKETTHPEMAKTGRHFEFIQDKTNLKIRFDRGEPNKNGFAGRDHYHVYNPKATGNKDLYLDKNGKPVKHGSRESHIFANGGKK